MFEGPRCFFIWLHHLCCLLRHPYWVYSCRISIYVLFWLTTVKLKSTQPVMTMKSCLGLREMMQQTIVCLRQRAGWIHFHSSDSIMNRSNPHPNKSPPPPPFINTTLCCMSRGWSKMDCGFCMKALLCCPPMMRGYMLHNSALWIKNVYPMKKEWNLPLEIMQNAPHVMFFLRETVVSLLLIIDTENIEMSTTKLLY
jgi:hypothetical protein